MVESTRLSTRFNFLLSPFILKNSQPPESAVKSRESRFFGDEYARGGVRGVRETVFESRKGRLSIIVGIKSRDEFKSNKSSPDEAIIEKKVKSANLQRYLKKIYFNKRLNVWQTRFLTSNVHNLFPINLKKLPRNMMNCQEKGKAFVNSKVCSNAQPFSCVHRKHCDVDNTCMVATRQRYNKTTVDVPYDYF